MGLGIEVLVVTAPAAAIQARSVTTAIRDGARAEGGMNRAIAGSIVLLAAVQYVPFVVAAMLLLAGVDAGVTVLAAAIVVAVVASMIGACSWSRCFAEPVPQRATTQTMTRSTSVNATQAESIVGRIHHTDLEKTTPPVVLTARAVSAPARWRRWEGVPPVPESTAPSTADVDAMCWSPSIALTLDSTPVTQVTTTGGHPG